MDLASSCFCFHVSVLKDLQLAFYPGWQASHPSTPVFKFDLLIFPCLNDKTEKAFTK